MPGFTEHNSSAPGFIDSGRFSGAWLVQLWLQQCFPSSPLPQRGLWVPQLSGVSGTDSELQGREAAVLSQPGEMPVQCVNNPCTPDLPDQPRLGDVGVLVSTVLH